MVVSLNSQDGAVVKRKKLPTCPRCKIELDSRVPRGFLIRNLLFFLPVKRYICYRCQRKRYVLA